MATPPLRSPLDDPAHIAAQEIADRLTGVRTVARNDFLAEMASPSAD